MHRFSSLRTEGMIDDLFDRAVEVGAGAFKFEILSPADALIQRAVNNAFDKARSMRLIWIVDVVKLADTLKPPEWEHLARTSPSYNARSAVEFSLKAAQEWFELRLPEGFDDFNDWPPPSSFESRSWIKAARSYDGLIPLLQLCNSPSSSVIEKLRAYFHLAFPQKRSMRKDYAAGKHHRAVEGPCRTLGKVGSPGSNHEALGRGVSGRFRKDVSTNRGSMTYHHPMWYSFRSRFPRRYPGSFVRPASKRPGDVNVTIGRSPKKSDTLIEKP